MLTSNENWSETHTHTDKEESKKEWVREGGHLVLCQVLMMSFFKFFNIKPDNLKLNLGMLMKLGIKILVSHSHAVLDVKVLFFIFIVSNNKEPWRNG